MMQENNNNKPSPTNSGCFKSENLYRLFVQELLTTLPNAN